MLIGFTDSYAVIEQEFIYGSLLQSTICCVNMWVKLMKTFKLNQEGIIMKCIRPKHWADYRWEEALELFETNVQHIEDMLMLEYLNFNVDIISERLAMFILK